MNTNGKIEQRQHHKWLLLILACCLLAMLTTELVQRLKHPALVVQIQPDEQFGVQSNNVATDEIGKLMEEAASKPQDKKTLFQLIEALMHAQKWEAAATFASRAVALDAKDPHPLFLQSVILHNQGKYKEAATVLEHILTLQDSAPIRYSLGVLCIYYLDQKNKGLEHLRQALKDPTITPELKKEIEEELQKGE